MTRTLKFFYISIVLAVQIASAEESQVWDSAASEILRLDPDSFENLSTEIIEYLDELGCTIPQTRHPPHPHNIVQGHLDDSGVVDVALLCSIEQRSAILVFWEGSASNADQVSSWSDDKGWLQTGAEGIEFSRTLGIASAELIIRYSISYESDLIVIPDTMAWMKGFKVRLQQSTIGTGKTGTNCRVRTEYSVYRATGSGREQPNVWFRLE